MTKIKICYNSYGVPVSDFELNSIADEIEELSKRETIKECTYYFATLEIINELVARMVEGKIKFEDIEFFCGILRTSLFTYDLPLIKMEINKYGVLTNREELELVGYNLKFSYEICYRTIHAAAMLKKKERENV